MLPVWWLDALKGAGTKVNIGFTGTRKGMTFAQAHLIKKLLEDHRPHMVHHGDCVGADWEFHRMAVFLRSRHNEPHITVHPPENASLRAFCEDANQYRDPAPYRVRNRAIVNSSDLVLAAPVDPYGGVNRRGGTWSTVRYALKVGKNVVVVHPNGQVERYEAK